MRLATVLVLLGLLVVAGCESASEPAADAAKPTTTKQESRRSKDQNRDLDWLRRVHRWEVRFDREAVFAISTYEAMRHGQSTKRKFRSALREIADCERELRHRVGEPVATPYRRGFGLIVKGCRSRARAARRLIEAIAADETVPSSYLTRENAKGDAFFEQARDDLEAALRANRELPVTRGKDSRSRIEPRLSRAVSELIWRMPTGIEVRCWSEREWSRVQEEWSAYVGSGDLLGFVHQNLSRTSIAPEPCALLSRFVSSRARPTEGVPLLEMAASLGLLAHEADHLSDPYHEQSEATTECYGMQRLRWLVRILGASKDYADLIATTYWTEIYPLNRSDYKTAACRDGGPLDKHPGSSIWP